MDNSSEYIIYADESGDHGLVSIDAEHPVFVLVFCIFKKVDYSDSILPIISRFKFKWFGHDNIILHSRDIRKQIGHFGFLTDQKLREVFIPEVNDLIAGCNFTLIASVIDKLALKSQYHKPENPYDLALEFCIERAHHYLRHLPGFTSNRPTHIITECRGKQEDKDLELAFHRIIGGKYPFKLYFGDKKANLAGLQIADLVAYPIGKKIINPEKQNRAFEIIETKFRKYGGTYERYGLKIFPKKH